MPSAEVVARPGRRSGPLRLVREAPRLSGEAGTAPGDRKFRPDVEGLRAVAIALVVLYHAGVGPFSGGYVGVDVFFVISGFVITGLLLRERASTGRTSLRAFYGRRARRILPAATLVIVVTLLASYHYLGFLRGDAIAGDARSAALFVANFHFSALGTNYLSSQQPPSPLQNFWSLSVEEQFYVVYPSLFLLVAATSRNRPVTRRLAVVLVAIIAASFVWSIQQTATSPTLAYFSPLTRAWELALGALVALGTPYLARVPRVLAATMSWVGLGAVAFAAVVFNGATAYPGSSVALPVLGTAAIIAAGASQPRFGAEVVLGLRPFQVLGLLSYSLYLWHWPLLALAAQAAGHSLSVGENLPWVLMALVVAAVSYRFVENPIRRSAALARLRFASLGLGGALIGVTMLAAALEIGAHP